MNDISKAQCLLSLYSNPKPHFSLIDDELIWHDSRPKPTETEIKTQTDLLQAEYDAQEWGTQLNKIYDDGIDKWKTEMVDPVKAKHPKP